MGVVRKFTIEPAERLKRLPPYVFGRLNEQKYRMRRAGIDVIDLGMGNPSDPPPKVVLEKLREAVLDPRNHRYSFSRGLLNLRKEAAKLYAKRWGVKLLSHKNSKHRRLYGTLGPKRPGYTRPTVPQAGQVGYHQRTEFNKRVLP